jgi:hypothetical protein
MKKPHPLLETSLPGLAWLAVLAACLALRERMGLLSASIWGLLVLASLVAWGAALGLALGRGERRGWGFHGAVGMALTIALGGVLALLKIVSTGLLVTYLLAGPFVWGALSARAHGPLDLRGALRRLRPSGKPTRWIFGFVLAVCGGVMLLQYLGTVPFLEFNIWDDNMAYREFVHQFLDTGTLAESYSYRRIGSYGGQPFLQALVLALSDRDRLHILDNGICALLMFGLAIGFRARGYATPRAALLGGAVLAATMNHTPANLGSQYSGVVLFLALFRLFDEPGFEEADPRSNALLAGLLAAAICTLRQNFLPAAVLLVGFTYLGLWVSPGARSRRDWARQAGRAYLAMGLFLLPWMILSLRSVGTIMYPVFKGYARKDFGIVGTVTFAEEIRWSIENLLYQRPLRTLFLMFATALALPMTRRNRAVHAFLLTNVVAFALMMHFFRAFHDKDSISRYYMAFTMSFAFAAVARGIAGATWERSLPRALPGAVLGILAVSLHLWITVGETDILRNRLIKDAGLAEQVFERRGPGVVPGPVDALYKRIQDSVPAREPLLVMLDHTYLLDFRRNPISVYDHPGAMGPPPGPPDFQGPEPWAAYMLSQGIRYLAYQLGEGSPEYRRSAWNYRAAIVIDATGRNGFYKNQARFELDFFDVLEALQKTRRSLYDEATIHVLDLATRK